MQGTTAFVMVLLSVTYTICVENKNWNKTFIVIMLISALGIFPYIFFLSYFTFPTENLLGVGIHLFINLRILVV